MKTNMVRRNVVRRGLLIVVSLLVLAAAAAVALAGNAHQAVEWSAYRTGALKWGLSYAGLVNNCEGEPNNWNYKFWVNKTASADPDRYKLGSFDSRTKSIFSTSRPVYGSGLYNLRPYICIGLRDTWNDLGPSNVINNLFVWVQ